MQSGACAWWKRFSNFRRCRDATLASFKGLHESYYCADVPRASARQSGDATQRMKFQRIEFSWRAAFVGIYVTLERDKLWITLIPFVPLYFKRIERVPDD